MFPFGFNTNYTFLHKLYFLSAQLISQFSEITFYKSTYLLPQNIHFRRGDGGTTVTGTTDRNGQIVWRDLPADEKYTLTETSAPEGYQIVAPMNVTLTPGRTEYLTVTDDVEHGFTVKKVDAQNKGSLQGAVFRFEQIDEIGRASCRERV